MTFAQVVSEIITDGESAVSTLPLFSTLVYRLTQLATSGSNAQSLLNNLQSDIDAVIDLNSQVEPDIVAIGNDIATVLQGIESFVAKLK